MSQTKSREFRYFLFIYLFVLFIPCSVDAMTLDDALKASLNYESQLKISQLNLKQSDAVLNQAKARDGLKINLVGQLDYEKVETPTGVLFPTAGNRKGRSAQLQLDYPLFTSGRHRLGIEVADRQLAANTAALSDQKSQTILNTVTAYTDVLKNKAILDLKKQLLNNLQRSLYEAQRRFDAGVITRADLAQVVSQFAQGNADVTQAESNLKISNVQFYQITGLVADSLEQIKKIPTIPNDIDQMIAMTSHHPALEQIQYEKQSAEKQLALTKRELWPSVMLTSRIGKQHEANYIGSESDNYMVGMQLNIPLYDDGLNRANIKKAQIDIELAQQKLESLQHDLRRQVQSSYAQLLAIRENKTALQNAIEAASIALIYTRKEFELGTKTTFDLLTTQQKLLDVQTQSVVNDQDEIVLVYQILEQMGYLSSNSMSQKNMQDH
ncbi:TolC family protein [Acinetobacter ursingii]|uniref:TolC family protein n=1 Tax=Acinetobacter ursingii TaxID=108980 RepID=UPI0012506920|nr:TolC family protein [Acinetobacter ursingii]